MPITEGPLFFDGPLPEFFLVRILSLFCADPSNGTA
jgi:hypothetical protein